MKKLFYTKETSLGGRVKYVPVAEYDSDYLDSFPKGNHLVMCYPGGSTRRYNIEPNYAAMIAAGRVAEDAVCDAIVKAQELRPSKAPITEHQRKLWKELAESFRNDYPLIRPAARDAADAAVKAMTIEAEKLMQHPSVKKAYEQFLMICELTKSNQGEIK